MFAQIAVRSVLCASFNQSQVIRVVARSGRYLCAGQIRRGFADDKLTTVDPKSVVPSEEEKAKIIRKREKQPHDDNPSQLMEFFEPESQWGAKEIKSGRAWKKEELRIKSNSDLHKLWFVLLKERNMLLTMQEAGKEQLELFASPERIDKVEESMCNLEDVVRERNKAYWQLEVGEHETGERRAVYRRDQFGRHRM